MKFRTEVNLPVSDVSLEIEDHVFSMGSCFATELSDLLQTGQIQTLNNPFGTVFNPFSINHAIKKLHNAEFYTEEDLVQFNEAHGFQVTTWIGAWLVNQQGLLLRGGNQGLDYFYPAKLQQQQALQV